MQFTTREILVATTTLLVFWQVTVGRAQTTEPAVAGSSVTVQVPTTVAAPNSDDQTFIRLTRDIEDRPLALQTATARYESKGGVIVDLVGVVHIGDRKYYSQLNEQFKQYDVVLYELVAPEGTRIPKGGREQTAGNPISMMQGMAKSMLGLESQMDHIDYTAENLVHADMSPEDMAEAMRKRGDNAITFTLSAVADILRQANVRAEELERRRRLRPESARTVEEEPIDLIAMLTDASASSKMKIQMAEQFGAMSSSGMSLGATLDQSIVMDRNAATIRVFQKQLAAGHKRIAIFYGAAHMPDFEKRLIRDFGLKRTRTEWLTGWDLTIKPAKTESPLSILLRMLGSP